MTHLDPPTGLGWLVYKTLHGGDVVSEETLAAGWRALSEARRAPYEAAGAAVLHEAAKRVEGMVIGGRQWTEDQAFAARVLFDVADGLRRFGKEVSK
jgi:hypothetical protein